MWDGSRLERFLSRRTSRGAISPRLLSIIKPIRRAPRAREREREKERNGRRDERAGRKSAPMHGYRGGPIGPVPNRFQRAISAVPGPRGAYKSPVDSPGAPSDPVVFPAREIPTAASHYRESTRCNDKWKRARTNRRVGGTPRRCR